MRTADMFKLAFKALRDRKLRSFLTILGIMIGSAVILALIASSNGLSAGISTSMGKMGANTLTVMPAMSFMSSGSQSQYKLSQDDVRILSSISAVKEVIPYYSRGMTITIGGTTISGTLVGIDLSKLQELYKGIGLSSGTFPGTYDVTAAAIGNYIAFPKGSTVQLSVNEMFSASVADSNLAFLVKGILSPYGSVLFSNIDETVFIGLQAAEVLLKTPYYTGFYVITSTADDVASVQAVIENHYGDNARVMNAGSMVSSIQSITSQMTVFLGSIGAVSLFVAAVGITNTMFVSVMERTREIGVLKAIGYTPGQIMGLFLSEASISGVLGGVGGTILGYVLSFMIGGALPMSGGMGGPGQTSSSTFTPVFTPELIAFSLLFPIGMAVLAGLYPARRASRMNAVVALKYE
jgi:putative ABC transport system permease protein